MPENDLAKQTNRLWKQHFYSNLNDQPYTLLSFQTTCHKIWQKFKPPTIHFGSNLNHQPYTLLSIQTTCHKIWQKFKPPTINFGSNLNRLPQKLWQKFKQCHGVRDHWSRHQVENLGTGHHVLGRVCSFKWEGFSCFPVLFATIVCNNTNLLLHLH